MGIAEVIPGVSGGTIALILGVYERLIEAIRSFDISLLRLLKQGRYGDSWDYIDGNYILVLFLGMVISIFTLSSLILFLMAVYPAAFKAFLSAVLVFSAFLEPLKPKISRPFVIGIILSFIICSFLYLLPEKDLATISPLYFILFRIYSYLCFSCPGHFWKLYSSFNGFLPINFAGG